MYKKVNLNLHSMGMMIPNTIKGKFPDLNKESGKSVSL